MAAHGESSSWNVRIRRIYEPPDGGFRVLVDRLWPRGVSKAKADLDEWLKDLAPSTELRKWFAHREDRWAASLRQMGMALGRFIYLLDAVLDYDRDAKKGKYNPYIAMEMGEDWQRWEDYLVLTMARCTDFYERLPLVQDKDILDNILYSGVWVEYRRRQRKKGEEA